MSFERNSAFERREDWAAAHLSGVEYHAIARALRALAGESEALAEPAIAEARFHQTLSEIG